MPLQRDLASPEGCELLTLVWNGPLDYQLRVLWPANSGHPTYTARARTSHSQKDGAQGWQGYESTALTGGIIQSRSSSQ